MAQPISGERPWRRSRLVLRIPDPAAGADWTLTVPAGHVYQPLSVWGQLVTSAAVANRLARLLLGDGNVSFLTLPAAAIQAATLTNLYAWAIHAPVLAVGADQLSFFPPLALVAGQTLASSTRLLDAADQWSSVRVNVIDTWTQDGAIALDDLPELRVELISSAEG